MLQSLLSNAHRKTNSNVATLKSNSSISSTVGHQVVMYYYAVRTRHQNYTRHDDTMKKDVPVISPTTTILSLYSPYSGAE